MNSTSRSAVEQRNKGKMGRGGNAQAKHPSPWRTYAGIWRENPDFGGFIKEIEGLRRESDEAELKSR